jgi:hypothetical protein
LVVVSELVDLSQRTAISLHLDEPLPVAFAFLFFLLTSILTDRSFHKVLKTLAISAVAFATAYVAAMAWVSQAPAPSVTDAPILEAACAAAPSKCAPLR